MPKEQPPKIQSKEKEPELYDFYYSAKQAEGMKRDLVMEGTKRPNVYIHGKLYTEAVRVGEKPGGNFDDYELVHSGGEIKDTKTSR